MEYYDEVKELLSSITNRKASSTTASQRLTDIFAESSGKELWLIFAEWLALNPKLSFPSFREVLPFLITLIGKLRNASVFLFHDVLDALYEKICGFDPEQISSIYEVIATGREDCFPIAYTVLVALVAPEIAVSDATALLDQLMGTETEVSKEMHREFFQLPLPYQLAYARSGLLFPERVRGFSLERLCLLLMSSSIAVVEMDGIKMTKSVTSPTSAKKLFHAVITRGPFMPTVEAARDAWKTAGVMLDSFNEEDRYHTIRAELEDAGLPETARSALTQRVRTEIATRNGGIFRSPLAGHLIPLVIPHDYAMSPVSKTEAVITALNFVKFMLLLDRKSHCFQIMMAPEAVKIITQFMDQLEKSLKRARTDNERNNEAILKDIKKVNMGKDVKAGDIGSIKQGVQSSISRIAFALSDIRTLLP